MSPRPNPFSSESRPIRGVLAFATAMVCAAALAAAPATADAGPDRPDRFPKLKGTVGPGFTISIDKTSVPAGRYRLIVTDLGTSHNFWIRGTGVDERTSVPLTGKTVWKLDLVQGIYHIRCQPHGSMKTKLTVT